MPMFGVVSRNRATTESVRRNQSSRKGVSRLGVGRPSSSLTSTVPAIAVPVSVNTPPVVTITRDNVPTPRKRKSRSCYLACWATSADQGFRWMCSLPSDSMISAWLLLTKLTVKVSVPATPTTWIVGHQSHRSRTIGVDHQISTGNHVAACR